MNNSQRMGEKLWILFFIDCVMGLDQTCEASLINQATQILLLGESFQRAS